MNHLETNIKEEEEEEEERGEEKISPKHASKLQFSIAQIMGFDRGERKPEKEEVEEERPSQPAKLWRPLAHCPTTSTTSTNPSSSLMLPSEPPAIALLRHYTLLRSRDPWRSLMPPGPGPGPLLPPSLTPPQHFRFPTFPFPESTKILGKAEETLTSLTASKQKTYPCPQCGKIFNAHYNLTRHMPVHTGK